MDSRESPMRRTTFPRQRHISACRSQQRFRGYAQTVGYCIATNTALACASLSSTRRFSAGLFQSG
jgi:hypothetical protein